MTQPIVQVQKIKFFYKNSQNPIFHHLEFSIQPGQKIALMGVNGSGKSTLLKILNGILFPQEGEYFFDQQKITKQRLKNKEFHLEFRKRCALLFQNFEFMLFHFKVIDDLIFTLKILDYSKVEIQRRLEIWSERFQVQELLNENPLFLSSGQKKRVVLTSLFMLEADLLLLDEPFDNLDPIHTGVLVDVIKQSKSTILFTTHNFELSKEICDHLWILHPKYNLLYQGSFDDFFSNNEVLYKSELFHFHSEKDSAHIHSWNS
ncbi:MAG: energy-coupling factor ABC transporter ATP-binding protein [Leptospiraceae bacterium]|nr:energy-coupling factor ABC transporter ATP-binding protein [Leptospiraceae bacterium]MDW7975996.1 ABC transporter ATP-binding protein [Leptospiraceae bacterium]